jgi:DNA-binding MarR family transcriptional regulator
MPKTMREELKQAKPFGSLEQEAMLSIARSAAVLEHGLADALRDFGVTQAQYNVLRILRGAGSAGLCRYEIRDRLIAQVPDVTRLLDRLEDQGLVGRERDTGDRRVVTTMITRKGQTLLAQIDAPLADFHRRQLGHLSRAKLRTLIDLLAEARDGA